MAIQNPRFEKAANYPGEAEGWTLRTLSSLWEFAGFGDEPEVAWERFDRHATFFSSLESVGFVLAFFDIRPEEYEDFEENWLNDVYLRELSSGHVEDLGIDRMADHDYMWKLENTQVLVADFTGRDLEHFAPDKYIEDLNLIESERVAFNGGTEFENFDEQAVVEPVFE